MSLPRHSSIESRRAEIFEFFWPVPNNHVSTLRKPEDLKNHLLAKAFGRQTKTGLGYCSLQVGCKWQWPLGNSAREERRVVQDDEQQSGEVRRSGKIVEGAMAKISLALTRP